MKGIRRDRYGWRAYVKVGGRQREKRFPPNAIPKKMQDWRAEVRVALRALQPTPAQPGSL